MIKVNKVLTQTLTTTDLVLITTNYPSDKAYHNFSKPHNPPTTLDLTSYSCTIGTVSTKKPSDNNTLQLKPAAKSRFCLTKKISSFKIKPIPGSTNAPVVDPDGPPLDAPTSTPEVAPNAKLYHLKIVSDFDVRTCFNNFWKLLTRIW